MAKRTRKTLKTGFFSRSMSLTKLSFKSAVDLATVSVGTTFKTSDEKQIAYQAFASEQLERFAEEFGQLKGSLMKVGQLLALVGEYWLPPGVVNALKSLHSEAPAVEWAVMEGVLKRQLSPEKLAELEIDPKPWASASIGQVHRALRRSDGQQLVLKIQYPGVDSAIEGDLFVLKHLLSLSRLFPKGFDRDYFFKEMRTMLRRETRYDDELAMMESYRQKLGDDPHYCIPQTFPEYCTRRVLATSFEAGVMLNDPTIKELPQVRRNAIAALYGHLHFREIFEFQLIQTDTHFGNYLIRSNDEGVDQFVLLDFGAMRKLSQRFTHDYRALLGGMVTADVDVMQQGAHALGLWPENASDAYTARLCELMAMMIEGFIDDETRVPQHLRTDEGAYRWNQTDLPDRIATKVAQIFWAADGVVPPQEFVALDRKNIGFYSLLKILDAEIRGYPLIEAYL